MLEILIKLNKKNPDIYKKYFKNVTPIEALHELQGDMITDGELLDIFFEIVKELLE